MVSVARVIPLFLLLTGLLAAGCEDDFGARCTLPTKVREACQQQASSSGLESHVNCTMDENLDCSSKICAVYQDSEPFCSKECSTDADCPGSARCMPFLIFQDDYLFCVPEDKIPAATE